MHKRISEMTASDKAEFLEQTKQTMIKEHGIPWEIIEEKISKEIEDIFDDEKFAGMNPESRIDAAYARRKFGDHKPELADYLLWSLEFVTKSEYVDW